RRIGACADTGHWASSGIMPMEALKILESRILNLHLKDRPEIGKPRPDVIFGTGVCDVASLLAELRRQKFDGNIFVEYENKFEDNVEDVKQCLDFVRDPKDYSLTDPELMLVKIDSDPKESFLGLCVDGMGRIFAGGREALFVYEPDAKGLYQSRKELYRFQKDAWIYDIAVRARDLYVLTVGALYVFRDGVVKREGLQPERLMWGMPVAHVHQGLHGMTFGPDGDLYISQGDQLWYYGDFKQRPDHWGHWTIYHGPDNTPTPYTGTGGVLRLSPDGKHLAIFANGTRNDCGLAFDTRWNLFGNDNDHESMPQEYTPGRLLHIIPHAYFNWPRGWMPEKQPWRSDLLETMTPNLGRYVPVGMCYYNDDFLPEKYRDCLYVARWGVRTIPRYPLHPAGDTFKTDEQPFLVAKTDARPVNVTVGRGGRLFAAICYMAQNEESPVYRSDLVMITTAADAPNAPFRAFDETQATPEQLMKELDSPAWSRRFRAHLELTRRGADSSRAAAAKLDNLDAKAIATPHLIWLAAADVSAATRSKLAALTRHTEASVRSVAVRALARFGAGEKSREIFLAALKDSDPQICHAALVGFFDQTNDLPFDEIAAAACEDGTCIRQTAAFLLARRASLQQLFALCEDSDAKRRRAGVLAAGFRLTVPEFDKAPDKTVPLDLGMKHAYTVTYAGGVQADLRAKGLMGNFTQADAWAKRAKTIEDETLFSLLERRLHDANENLAKQAAFFLRLLKDERSDKLATTVLGLTAHSGPQGSPLTNATTTGATELPEAFRHFDWTKEVAQSDVKKGQELFATRGCAVCHSAKAGDHGSGGPTLIGAGSRFTVPYFVESIITPNKTISPIFRWTLLKLKNDEEFAGLITSETGAEVEVLLPAATRRTVQKAEIVSREIQDRSPMPEGLIQTAAELRDLLSFLLSEPKTLKEVSR
ncbi:MAG: c-type cytochrome, partial [Chloroflexi bacterium]|nr:c-type cytochrome [Chloroflexota bacterium]